MNKGDNFIFIRSGILLILLVVLNLIAFTIYQNSHMQEAIAEQQWNYFESDTFKIITVSIILPLLLFFLENHFKVLETIEEHRQDRERLIDEEHKKLVLERTVQRWEAIKRTEASWNDLFELTSRVVHFDPTDTVIQKELSIKIILQKIDNFSNYAEDVVNTWAFWFPNVSLKDWENVLICMNLMLNASATIAYAIWDGVSVEEMKLLQDSLANIRDLVKTSTHHTLLNILKYSSRLLALTEDNIPDSEQQLEIKHAEDEIKQSLNVIMSWANYFKEIENTHSTVIHTFDNQEIVAFLDMAKKYEDWQIANPQKGFADYDSNAEFRTQYYKVEFRERMFSLTRPYSLVCIHAIADELSYEHIISRIQLRRSFFQNAT